MDRRLHEVTHGDKLTLSFEGEDVPACADCHTHHQVQQPATSKFRLSAPQLCAKCHGEKYAQFSATAHSRPVTDRDTDVRDRGCEACHGPGAEHAKLAESIAEAMSKPGAGDVPPPSDWRIFDPRKAPAADVAARCTRCHVEQTVARQHDHVEHDPKARGWRSVGHATDSSQPFCSPTWHWSWPGPPAA